MKPLDIALLGLAMAGFGGALIAGAQRVEQARFLAAGTRAVAFSGGQYTAPHPATAPAAGRAWLRPAPPAERGRWIFDLFTPPLVRRDPRRGAVATAAPVFEAADVPSPADGPPPVTLLAVRLRPYRFRLAGYAGRPERPVVTLEETATGESFLLRAGVADERHGVAVRRVELRRIRKTDSEGGDVVEEVAAAVLHDLREGRDVELAGDGGRPAHRLVAVLQTTPGGPPEEVAAGGETTFAGAVHTVRRISREPPWVELAAGPGGAGPAVLRLAPAPGAPRHEEPPARPGISAPPNPAESSDETRAFPDPSRRADPGGGDP